MKTSLACCCHPRAVPNPLSSGCTRTPWLPQALLFYPSWYSCSKCSSEGLTHLLSQTPGVLLLAVDEHPWAGTQTHLAAEGRAEEAQDSRGRGGSACHYHADTSPKACLVGSRRKQKKASEAPADGKTMSLHKMLSLGEMCRISCPWHGVRIRWTSRSLPTQPFCGSVMRPSMEIWASRKLSWGIKAHSVYRDRSAHVPGRTSCSAWAPATAVLGQAADLALGTAGKNRLFLIQSSLLIYTSLVLMNCLLSPLK